MLIGGLAGGYASQIETAYEYIMIDDVLFDYLEPADVSGYQWRFNDYWID